MRFDTSLLWLRVALVVLVAGGLLALGGLLVSRSLSIQQIRDAVGDSHRSAVAFSQLVSTWLVFDTSQQVDRVAHIVDVLLQENCVYITISHLGEKVADARAPGWDNYTPPQPQRDHRTAQGASGLVSARGALIVDSRISFGGEGGSESIVQIGRRNLLLETHLPATVTITSAVAAAFWLLVSAVAWILFAPHRQHAVTEPPAERAPLPEQIPDGNGSLQVDLAKKVITHSGTEFALPPKPFRLLGLLAENSGRVVSDREILDHVWRDVPFADASDIRQCVYRLRRHLDDIEPGLSQCILNVKGFGYRFNVEGHDPEA